MSLGNSKTKKNECNFNLPITNFSFDRWNTDYDYWNNLARLKQIPEMLKDIKILLQTGIQDGVTFAKESLDKTKKQFERLQYMGQNVTRSAFFQMFAKHDGTREEAAKVITNEVLPAFKDLEEYLFNDYYQYVRSKPSVKSMSNLKGEEFYQASLEYFTTLSNVNADDLHQYGLESLQRSQIRLKDLALRLGYANDSTSIADIFKNVKADGNLYLKSDKEVLHAYVKSIGDIKTNLPKIFDKKLLPKKFIDINLNPNGAKGGGIAYYQSGSADGRRSDGFHINAANVKRLVKGSVDVFTLHEAFPGHFMRITIKNSQTKLPNFVKYSIGAKLGQPSTIPKYSAFIEGWGLYSQYLGYDLGLYASDPMKEIAYLMSDILKSARMVADTGLHMQNWSKKEAVEFLETNAALSEAAAQAEVDRYITLPGQAVAYKIGEREILKMRKKFTSSGSDLKEFHSAIMNCEGPLNLLESCLNVYLNKE